MTLIKSISGIRGTIGGTPGQGLTPVDTVKFAAAFGTWVQSRKGKKVVIGRDARLSGEMVSALVAATLQGLGLDVIDLGLSTTPTVEIAVTLEKSGAYQARGYSVCPSSLGYNCFWNLVPVQRFNRISFSYICLLFGVCDMEVTFTLM